MDPITHGMVGLTVASISGEPTMGAVSIGAALGAMSPDLDIVMQCKGHLSYLKNHRGKSHSLPFLGGMSLVIASILSLTFPKAAFTQIIFWTFIGALSHSLLDILNSYGAQIFWPISKKRYSGSLLLCFDPVIILLSLYMILSREPSSILAIKVGGIFFTYLYIRLMLKNNIYDKIFQRFGKEFSISNIKLFPSMTRIYKLHFIIEAKEKFMVGEVNLFNGHFEVLKELEKRNISIHEKILRTEVGEFFQTFTPIYHVDIHEHGEYYYVTFTDLRFIVKGEFMHHATAILSKDLEIVEGIFHPYSFEQSISLI